MFPQVPCAAYDANYFWLSCAFYCLLSRFRGKGLSPPQKNKLEVIKEGAELFFFLIMIKAQLTPKVKKPWRYKPYGQGHNCGSFCERNCAVHCYLRTNFSLGKIRKVNDSRNCCKSSLVHTPQHRRRYWPKSKTRLIFVMDFNLPRYLYSNTQDHTPRNKKIPL